MAKQVITKTKAKPKENFKSGTLWTRDNLEIMRGLNSRTVDLIYLDPPFNSNRDYAAPVGSKAAGAAFKDTWTLNDVDNAWHGEIADKDPAIYSAIAASELAYGRGMKSYLIMMAVRLMEMKRLMKPTASIYLHCDPTASHYLKILMDAVFGRTNFRNEIIWSYSGWNKRLKHKFESRHDVVYFYAKGKTNRFNSYSDPWESEQEYIAKRRQKVHEDEHGRKYVLSDAGDGKRVKRYLGDAMEYGAPVASVWAIDKINNSSKERVGYPTQKPLALLDRIIKASSDEGDLILDPFCGCATTLIAAEKLKRRWLGIDLSSKAADLVKLRMAHEADLIDRFDLIHRHDLPRRTDLRGEPVNYRTHQHELFGKQEGRCNGCGHSFPFRNFTLDHIVPQKHGGSDHLANLQLLCGACNSTKGVGTQAQLLAKLKKLGLID